MSVTSLWIGSPGRLRAVPDAATDYDRSTDLGVTEFRALAGGITTTSLALPPRRLALSFTGLREADGQWLDALARRVFGPLPLALLEPGVANVLDGPQSQGLGPTSGYQLSGGGTLTQLSSRAVTVSATTAGAVLRFVHPHWFGWPVATGMQVGFSSALSPDNGLCVLDYFTATGAFIASSTPAATLYETPHPLAAFVRPAIRLNAVTSPLQIGSAWLSLDTPTTPGPVPIGDGCPAMSVTAYTDKPRHGHRDMTLTLVEVRRTRS